MQSCSVALSIWLGQDKFYEYLPLVELAQFDGWSSPEHQTGNSTENE